MAAIGGFRSDQLTEILETFQRVFQSRVSINENGGKLCLIASLNNCIQRGLELFLAKSIIPQMLNLVGDLSSLRSSAGTAQ